MLRWMMAMTTALSGVGCASSAKIEYGAQRHFERARAYELQGDFYSAVQEREAGERQIAKARRRAYEEQHFGVYRF